MRPFINQVVGCNSRRNDFIEEIMSAIEMLNSERLERIDEIFDEAFGRRDEACDCPSMARFGCPCSRCERMTFEEMREPDGIDLHVDRPTRDMFYFEDDFRDAMRKYRELERLARETNWPCREPMRGM